MLLKRPMIWCSPGGGFVIRRPASIAAAISRSTATASPPLDPALHSPALIDAAANGLLLDIGFGINFSYATARRMIAAGVLPHIISSDVHGLFPIMHDDSALDYSLAGAFARLVALGMPFRDALAAVTVNPARVLGDEGEIGTLAIGSRAGV